jgi:hypothetical protein
MKFIIDRTSIYTLAIIVALFSGCAGRPANPVMVYQPDDEERSCDALDREMELIEDQIRALMPETDKADKNTKLGVAGIFLLVPLFFMDLSKAEQIEVNALTKRYNHLLEIGEEKHCNFKKQAIPEFKKTDY